MFHEAADHILEAVLLGRTDILKALLTKVRENIVEEENTDGEVIDRIFLDFLNATRGENKSTFLHKAVMLRHRDLVRALLQEGADPTVQDGDGETVVDLLHRLDLPELNQVLSQVLFQAVAESNCKRVQELLDAGWNVNTTDTSHTRNTPLHWAATFGATPEIINLLLSHGADPNAVNVKGETPLDEANRLTNANLVKMLVDVGGRCASVVNESETKGGISDNAVEDTKVVEEPSLRSLSRLHALVLDERLNLLWPQPQHIRQLPGNLCCFTPHMTLSIVSGEVSVHSVLDVWDSHRPMLASVGRRVHLSPSHPQQQSCEKYKGILDGQIGDTDRVDVLCTISPSIFVTKGAYKLNISDNVIRITTGDLSGLHHAIATLVQLFRLFCHESTSLHGKTDESLSCIIPVDICDRPDSSVRAVLYDLNPYGRVPKMEIMFTLVRTWSLLKLNQFHVFVRVGKTSPNMVYTKNDLLVLDRYCRDHFVDLVPAVDLDDSVDNENDLDTIRSQLSNYLSCFERPK